MRQLILQVSPGEEITINEKAYTVQQTGEVVVNFGETLNKKAEES